jgi:hypothetical protein
MRRPPPALRHVVTHWVAFAAVALTALITAAFTAAAVSFISAVTSVAASSELNGHPGSAILVTASVSGNSLAQPTAAVTSLIQGAAGRGGHRQLAAAISTSGQSAVLNLPVGRPSLSSQAGRTRLQTQIVSLPDLGRHIAVLRGACGGAPKAGAGSGGNSAPGSAGGVPVCVSQTAARVLGLRAGEQITLRDSVNRHLVRVTITGIFRPLAASSAYWLLSPVNPDSVGRGSAFTLAGPLVTTPAGQAAGGFGVVSAAWLGEPDFAAMKSGDLAAIGNGLGGRINAMNGTGILADATVTTGLPGELTSLATALLVTRTQLLAGLLTLLVVAGATLALAVRLLAQRREGEAALLAARGASRSQLARRGLVDAVIVAGIAAAAGPLLGNGLARLLAASLRSDAAGHVRAWLVIAAFPAAATWLATAGVAACCVAIIALPWLRRPPSPLRRRASRGRQRSIAAAVYARADLVVVALAAGAVWQLTHSAGPVSAGLSGALSADPILVIAPVLALAAGAFLTLRALPLVARIGDRLAARGRGLTMPFAAWQISRRTLRAALPTLVAVLAVAAAVMAVAQRDSWRQSVQAQASFDVGADVRVNLPPAAPLAMSQVGSIVRAPGVTASTPAVRATINLPAGFVATLLALNGGAAARIIPAQAAGPPAAVLGKLAGAVRSDGVRLPGRPRAMTLTAQLSRGTLAQPQLSIQVMDAAGIGYLLPAGPLPADGRPHALRVPLSGAGGVDYPLRITGYVLQFTTPSRLQPAETLTVSGARALPADGSPAQPFPAAVPGGRLIFSAAENPGTRYPSAVRTDVTAGGAVRAAFDPGFANGQQSPGGITLSDSYPGYGGPLPAIATDSFLAATGMRAGQQAELAVDGVNVPIKLRAAVANLPTIGSGSPGVLVDQHALQATLLADGAQPESITEWWLRTGGHLALTGLPAGTSASQRSAFATRLLADPLSAASQQGLLGIALAAVLLAVIGLLVSVATAAERSRDAALLDALGMPPRQIARLLSLEQAMTAVATSAIGLVFGAGLSVLILPSVTLTAAAAKPVPPLVVHLPWLQAALVALAIALVPTLAVTLTLPRAASIATRIRAEDEA